MQVNNLINVFSRHNQINKINPNYNNSAGIRFGSNNQGDIFVSQPKDRNSDFHPAQIYTLPVKDTKLPNQYEVIRSKKAEALTDYISDEKVNEMLREAQKAAENTIKNHTAEFSKAHYGSAFLREDGTIVPKGNIEINRKFTICSERHALADFVEKNEKIKAIAISSPELLREDGGNVSSCELCLSWLNSYAEYNPYAKNIPVITPETDPASGKIIFKMRTLEEHLPAINYNIPSYTNKNISEFVNNAPIIFSNTISKNKINKNEIAKLLKIAKDSYLTSIPSVKAMGNNIKPAGVAVITESGKVYSGINVGPKARSYTPADIDAITNAIKTEVKKPNPSKIKAIAIFSKDDTSLPSTEHLSWLKTPAISKNVQIIKIEDDAIRVYSTKDFTPVEYSSLKNGD